MTGAALGAEAALHATAVIYGESGVLILGPSGSGKSALALALIARAIASGAFSALIGDDRIFVSKAHGRLLARGATHMAGLIERRAAGLIRVRHEPATVVRLAVELAERGRRWPRMPDADNRLVVGEATLPRLALDSGQSACDQALMVDERLAALAAEDPRVLGISLEHCAAVHKNRPLEYPPAQLRAGA
jgi:HPr kinase/phosphorylase